MEADAEPRLFTINSVAPIRICDIGGWTDTWFAGHGRILNIGVYPHVEVQLAVFPRQAREVSCQIHAENYGDRYAAQPGPPWQKHPLLEAAIQLMGVPEAYAVEATIYSQAPGGASTGTSAAVSVALVGALDQLRPGQRSAREIARLAHEVETELLGLQSGIQDQLCAAYGGINYIEMIHYPHASLSQLHLDNRTWWELERSLALIYLGIAHQSSGVHEMVIRSLENAGPGCPELEALRSTAPRARDALYAGDFEALGRVMKDNTAAQAELHPALVSEPARQVIEIARRYGALGWKVNGAGGDGGSLTLLCGPSSADQRALLAAIEAESTLYRNIPIYLSRSGLRVWKRSG